MNRKTLSLWAVLAAMSCSRADVPTVSNVAGPDSSSEPAAGVRAQAKELERGNCTLTQGFWKNHGSLWPVTSLTLGGVSRSNAELIALLRTPPRGDATINLVHQLIAATLNVENGADPSAVSSTLQQANDLLAANPVGSRPTGATREAMLAAADTLDRYNNGLIGPGHCDDDPPTPTPTATPTPTPTLEPTPTPSPTPEPTPTETPEPR